MQGKKQSTRRARLSMLAALAVASAAGVSEAQQRIDTGRALDANTRLGSGGYNTGRDLNAPTFNNYVNNALVTGNVTGGREFRGNINYTDPRAFRGSLSGGGIDRFVRGSAGVNAAPGLANTQTALPYFGDSRGVAPPPGFIQLNNSGGYVPGPVPSRIGSDLRLGSVYDTPTVALPRPGELLLPGPVDASNNNQLITASPIYGVRALNTGNPGDINFMRRYTTAFGSPDARAASDIDRWRAELSDTGDATDNALPNSTDNAPLPNTVGPAGGDAALSNDVRSGQQIRNQLVLAPAVKQSQQYQQLVRRLEQFNEQQKLDPSVAAAREYNEQLRLKAQLEAPATPPIGQPVQPPGAPASPDAGATPAMPGGMQAPAMPGAEGAAPALPGGAITPPGGQPGAPLVGPSRLAKREPPPVVTSLATGVEAKGLKQLLTEAEALMREQKFVSALGKYDLAEQVAPNNPMVLLGRANAELGASFYARAETHLREAFTGAPALMMAKYDLRSFLGDDRLAFLVKDLKEIANNEKASPRPLLLLAYIAYNEGNDRLAAGYLELAEKRSAGANGGAGDPVYRKIRDHWQLPAVGAEESDLNK